MDVNARTEAAIALIEKATEAALQKHADLCRGKKPRPQVRYVEGHWLMDEGDEYLLDEDGERIWAGPHISTRIYFHDWWDGPEPHVVTGWSETPTEVEHMLQDPAFASWVELKTFAAMTDLQHLEPPQTQVSGGG